MKDKAIGILNGSRNDTEKYLAYRISTVYHFHIRGVKFGNIASSMRRRQLSLIARAYFKLCSKRKLFICFVIVTPYGVIVMFMTKNDVTK